MGEELELLSDGDGLAIFGQPATVERFLQKAGVPSRELNVQGRLGAVLNTGSNLAQASSEIASNSGRWVKLTEDSVKAMQVGNMMKGSSSNVVRAVVTTDKGKIAKLVEFAKPGTLLSNPAVLAGAAGIMAQLAMEQTMQEITQYLAIIDEKVDDVLRAQKDATLAQMIGVGFVIDDAMTVRDSTGRVSEVTWSKVQGADQIVATTQAYALRQLDGFAEKLDKNVRIADLVKISESAEATVEEWLAVLARCFHLQEGLGILELDRMLDASPNELDRHRVGLQKARHSRREHISRTTAELILRMDAAAGLANQQVLFNPMQSGIVVKSGNEVVADLIVFNKHLGIESDRESIEAKRWVTAVGETKDRAIESGEQGVDAVRRFGMSSLTNIKSVGDKLSSGFRERFARKASEDDAAIESE